MDKPTVAIGEIVAAQKWDYSERRRDRRYCCMLDGVLGWEGQKFACEIFSLSRSGLAIVCDTSLPSGGVVELSCLQPSAVCELEPIDCRVERIEPYRGRFLARLSLEEPEEKFLKSWLWAELSDLGAQASRRRQRRRAVRVSCGWPVAISGEGWVRQGKILDLGMSGARIKCTGSVLPKKSFLLSFSPPDEGDPIVVLGTVAAAGEADEGIYGVYFTGFQEGTKSDLMRGLNIALNSQRSS